MDMKVDAAIVKSLIEKDPETQRPFRLWNPTTGEFVRWHYYSNLRNAYIGCLIHIRWEAKIGESLELLDVSKAKLIASFKRRVNDIQFIGGDNIPKIVAQS